MALLVRINETFSDTSLPVLPVVDAMESSGSLFLIDAKRSIPSAANGAEAVNLLNKPDIVNAPSLSVFINAAANTFGANLSAKGGLKFEPVPYMSAAWLGGALRFADPALFTYLKNSGHRVYTSWWGRCIRAFSTTDSTTLTSQSQKNVTHMAIGNSLGGNIRFEMAYTTFNAAKQTLSMHSQGTTDSAVEGDLNTVGNLRTIACFIPSSAIDTASMTADHMGVFCSGGYGALNYNLLQQAGIPAIVSMPAIIFYRFYVEDLDVSGRTYAQVKALDDVLYTKEVLTAGGKYYGDS